MSNRRMGGNLRGGNRPFNQPFQSGPVNPWQGGNANANQSGAILSQLTSNPQLALALSSLLQPQQQHQPPSLLSLNTSPAYSRGGDRDYGRFSGGGGNRGRDIRRHEPYNKNERFGGGGGGGRRRSPRRDSRNDRKKQPEKKVEKKEVKKDPEAAAEEGDEEKKRDWKDEKNQGDSKDVSKEESGDEEEGKKKEDSNKEGRYGGVPPKYLNCFVCNKQMWDGESMGKHLRGRAHREMMKALEESIHICVGILRENLRLAEERRVIEWNRQNRLKKYGRQRDPEMSLCNMCDLKFMGNILVHRRTDGHQRLKRYLHPSCRICDQEFPSRLDWINHRLTPAHLKRIHETTEKKEGGKDGDVITEGDGEGLDLDLEPLLDESIEIESDDPILEVDTPLDNIQNRMPAYKRNRPVASNSLKEFSGWMCEICNRSFADEQDAKDHLTTRRHFHRFVELIKEKHDRKEKREKAEKEAEIKKEELEGEENGVKEEEVDGEGEAEADEDVDQEMYDPSEVTDEKENGAAKVVKEEPPEEGNQADEKMVEEKVEKEEEVKEIAKTPATPKGPARKPGPKSKRGRK